jgi:general secretion pathway protein A
MYTQQFGLEKAVFDGGIAQHDDLFLGPRQQRIAANLKIGLTTRDAIVTLTGPLGVGKTTLAAHALSITATRLAQSWVGNTPLTPDEMLELLLAGFELAPYDMGRVQRLQTWQQFVSEMSATDTRICILVEDALELGPEGLKALEALTAAQPNDCPGANLILMGPTLSALLEEPGLARLRQRIRSRQRLEPMTSEEVEQYLKYRVTVAGGDYDTIFAPGTAAMVHRFSAGIVRVIDNVCETALIVAATRKAKQITPEIVQRVAEGVYSLTPSAKVPDAPVAKVPAPTAAPVAAAKPPAGKSASPAEPAPVDAKAATPAAALVATVKPPVEKPVPSAKPAPVDTKAAAPAAVALAAVEPLARKPVPHAEPAPIDAAVDPRDAEALQVAAILDATDSGDGVGVGVRVRTDGSYSDPGADPGVEPPILTDEFDIALEGDSEDVAGRAQPAAATLPPDAPALPNKELEADENFSEDFAAATHLHEISDEMAELLFSADPVASATGIFKKAAPLDSSELDLSPAATAMIRELDANALSGSDDDEAGSQALAASTLVF